MTRVLVAADSAVARAGLEALVRTSSGLELAGSSSGISTLSRQIDVIRPDVILLELDAEDPAALAALRRHASALDGDSGDPHTPALVLLAGERSRDTVAEALRSGARAVLSRQATAGEIVAAIEAAAAGLVALEPEAAELLLASRRSAPPGTPVSPRGSQGAGQALTAREVQVLNMLAEGLGNKEIAWRLSISEHTVKFHISSIFNKLDASSRTEAVTIGIRQGLVLI